MQAECAVLQVLTRAVQELLQTAVDIVWEVATAVQTFVRTLHSLVCGPLYLLSKCTVSRVLCSANTHAAKLFSPVKWAWLDRGGCLARTTLCLSPQGKPEWLVAPWAHAVHPGAYPVAMHVLQSCHGAVQIIRHACSQAFVHLCTVHIQGSLLASSNGHAAVNMQL